MRALNSKFEDTYEIHHNHATNIVRYDKVAYVHDVVNRTFYQFENEFVLKPYNLGNGYEEYLYYKPTADRMYNGYTKNITAKRIMEFYKSSNSRQLSIRELLKIYRETRNNYYKYGDAIKEFELENNPRKEKIISLVYSGVLYKKIY